MIDSNFVYALTLLAAGKKVTREAWDAGTYLEMRDDDGNDTGWPGEET